MLIPDEASLRSEAWRELSGGFRRIRESFVQGNVRQNYIFMILMLILVYRLT
jgi:hypothetical protein